MRNLFTLFIMMLFISCGNDPVPKPKAFLRLDFPKAQYQEIDANLPFTFEKNSLAKNIGTIKSSRDNNIKGLEIVYPSLKATIFLTYKKIDTTSLQRHLIDAQNITQAHAAKATAIIKQPFEDLENHVYGMLYEVEGNAASQSQFYITDSINHFLTGALYFYAKPNYDSILPAAKYVTKDIQHFMETLKWKQ
ncbi:MAG: gliding motility lipoprotein GldD [Flavobacteriaceae bacterium]|nr:gliding motility lipoprotein GldD [Flavobacteriaceae bacterium]